MVLPWRSPAPGVDSRSAAGSVQAIPAAAAAAAPAAASALPVPVPVPPARMPMSHGSRPLKRWTYVGVFGQEVMLCAGAARVGPARQAFWAVWDRHAGLLDTETVLTRTGRVTVGPKSLAVRSGAVRLELALSPSAEPVEVVSPHGGSYIWTRKTPIRADGHLTLGMEARAVSASGILDESAGYHARHTAWEWSAGVGVTVDGWPVTWNLVRGLHDSETMSERTVWVQGRPAEAPTVRFSRDLDELRGADGSVLRFQQEAVRRRRENLGLVRSDYVQPFGRFEGTLPGGVELSGQTPALGVMERHSAKW